ncbi:MAG: diacylglycerol kinase family lipid kinase [Dehalococcoidia bacterium]|nr:diacylglycerol kinase family lipid kinase [Dehalococcoidia bacterium]
MRRARLILNPIPWEHRVRDGLAQMMSSLEDGGIRSDVSFTKMTEAMTESVAQAVREGYDLVIAGGGDGTVSEVASGLVGTDIPLGIIPCGTFNNIATSLNIPHDLQKAVSILVAGNTREIDVGKVNQYYFFEAAGVGLDATIFPIGEEIKGGHYYQLFQASLRFLRYHAEEMTILLDDALEVKTRAPMVVVANGPYYGSGFNIAPEADLDDGLFSVVVFEACNRLEVASYFAATAGRRKASLPCISTYKASHLEIFSRVPLPAHADGRPIGTSPVTLQTIRRGLRVVAP